MLKLISVVAMLLAYTSTATADGKLSALRDEVRSESPSPDSEPEPKKRVDHEHDHCDDDDDDSFLGSVFLFAITSPWWAPIAAFDTGHAQAAQFPEHPYDNVPGALVIMSEQKDDISTWIARLRTEYGTDFDGLHRIGGKLLLDTSERIGFDADWNVWEEDMARGFKDSLWTGDANLVYRFAQNEHIQFRSGLGVAWLRDSAATDFGFNSTYSVDIYPRWPWSLSAELDLGKLGRESRTHFRATAGVVWSSLEFYAGYDILKVGSTTLDGVVFGFQVWY
ncbi:MAG: hypothetical protein O3A00_09795 [Planctomycetota bacterium]|nr:hypothetical protein [Planctomycetota bacterium]